MKARDNPFAVERLHQLRFRHRQESWPELLDRWRKMRCRGAIVGPEGRGKTTLLLEIAERLKLDWNVRLAMLRRSSTSPWQEFPPDLFANLCSRDCVLLDGAEQLNWLAWRKFLRLTRPAGGLIVTTHQPGRLATWIMCKTSPELLDELVHELLGSLDESTRAANRRLFAKHSGNLRLALREWYDWYADR